jgi:hypothetical protein
MVVHNISWGSTCVANRSISKYSISHPNPFPDYTTAPSPIQQFNNSTSNKFPTHPGPYLTSANLASTHSNLNPTNNNRNKALTFQPHEGQPPFSSGLTLITHNKLTSANTSSPPSNISFLLGRSLVDRITPNQRVGYGSSHHDKSLFAQHLRMQMVHLASYYCLSLLQHTPHTHTLTQFCCSLLFLPFSRPSAPVPSLSAYICSLCMWPRRYVYKEMKRVEGKR